jgi:hypothetical protein
MSFLAPALLAALVAIAIPVVVHLVQRERRTIQAFPSLMFLRRIPNQTVRRRAIRHWPLLALRILSLVLIALAFARPFLPTGGATVAAAGGARHVVVLLDRSASMGYDDHWRQAQVLARHVVRSLGPGDSGSVVFFSTDVAIGARSEAGPGALIPAVDSAQPGPGLTRFGPALRAAAGLLEQAPAASRREIVLVSDFQKSGWDATQDVKLPAGVTLTTVSVGEPSPANAAVVGLTLEQAAGPKGVLVTAAARVTNFGVQPVSDREITLDVDEHRVDSRRVSTGPGATATVAFAPFPVAGRTARVTVRMAADALPVDDVFRALVTVGGQVPVLILESASAAPDTSLYLARALEVAAAPGFATRIARADRVAPEEIAAAAVIVLNDARPPSGPAGRALASAINDGAGLLVLLGERSAWTDADPDLLPGKLGAPVDRSGTSGGTLGYVDFSHPAFEVFSSPRSGDLTAARVFRYRAITAPGTVLARFDDGAVAVAERKVGRGVVIAWSSTFDSYWNDLPLKPVFVPFVHQVMRHLGRYVEPRPWYTVGDAYDPADAPPMGAKGRIAAGSAFTVVAPSGRAVEPVPGAVTRTVPLSETGFYEIRPSSPGAQPIIVAVNGAAGESDLSMIDPSELRASVGAHPGAIVATPGHEVTVEERERRQSLWWYLLAAGLLLLVIEAVVASRLPRIA